MGDGGEVVVRQLVEREGLDGVIGMGGTAGTNVVTACMRGLPYGLPKICVSTVASANVSPYVGISDIIMIPTLTDIAGINFISNMMLRNDAGALTGMLGTGHDSTAEKPAIADSMIGNTTPCVETCME